MSVQGQSEAALRSMAAPTQNRPYTHMDASRPNPETSPAPSSAARAPTRNLPIPGPRATYPYLSERPTPPHAAGAYGRSGYGSVAVPSPTGPQGTLRPPRVSALHSQNQGGFGRQIHDDEEDDTTPFDDALGSARPRSLDRNYAADNVARGSVHDARAPSSSHQRGGAPASESSRMHDPRALHRPSSAFSPEGGRPRWHQDATPGSEGGDIDRTSPNLRRPPTTGPWIPAGAARPSGSTAGPPSRSHTTWRQQDGSGSEGASLPPSSLSSPSQLFQPIPLHLRNQSDPSSSQALPSLSSFASGLPPLPPSRSTHPALSRSMSLATPRSETRASEGSSRSRAPQTQPGFPGESSHLPPVRSALSHTSNASASARRASADVVPHAGSSMSSASRQSTRSPRPVDDCTSSTLQRLVEKHYL